MNLITQDFTFADLKLTAELDVWPAEHGTADAPPLPEQICISALYLQGDERDLSFLLCTHPEWREIEEAAAGAFREAD